MLSPRMRSARLDAQPALMLSPPRCSARLDAQPASVLSAPRCSATSYAQPASMLSPPRMLPARLDGAQPASILTARLDVRSPMRSPGLVSQFASMLSSPRCSARLDAQPASNQTKYCRLPHASTVRLYDISVTFSTAPCPWSPRPIAGSQRGDGISCGRHARALPLSRLSHSWRTPKGTSERLPGVNESPAWTAGMGP